MRCNHLDDMVQTVAMNSIRWNQNWKHGCLDYLRSIGMYQYKGNSQNQAVLTYAQSVDCPSNECADSYYLFNKESISRYEEENSEVDDVSDTAFNIEIFLMNFNLKRDVLLWAKRNYLYKINKSKLSL